MALRFNLYLSDPKAPKSTVYLRGYTVSEANRKKARNESFGVVPNLTIDTAHWHKGGLIAKAPKAQHDIIQALTSKIEALQADILTKPRHLSNAEVRSYLWASEVDGWTKLTNSLSKIERKGTHKLYRLALAQFKKFCERAQPTSELYIHWVHQMKKSDKAPATVNTYAGAVRSLLAEVGITIDRTRNLRANQGESGKDLHALTAQELTAIAKLELVQGSTLARVRDAFLCACLSSLRLSDWHYFSLEFIGQYVKNTKTRKRTLLPESVRPFIERNGGMINYPADPNKGIRQLAKLASERCPSLGLLVSYKGKNVPKWTAITSHCARRTFATLSSNSGASLEAIRQLTGHASDAQAAKYVKDINDSATDLERANTTSNLVLDLFTKGDRMKVAK